jgi:phage I-like protein
MNTEFHHLAKAIPLPESPEVPEWIQVFPAGLVHPRDGRGPWRCNAAKVAASTLAYFGDEEMPLDYEHQLVHSLQNGQPAPASGWVKALEARADGLWAKVEWTARAKEHIAAREYRYVSPTFLLESNGVDVKRLGSIALCNQPAMSLMALASANGPANHEETPMSLDAFRAAFGLPATADEAQILAHAQELKNKAVLAETKAAELQTAMSAKEKEGPDPTRFVPIGMYETAAANLAALQAKIAKESAAALVEEGAKAGKISPAMREWASSYAAKDPEGFRAYLDKAPALVTAAASGGQAKTTPPEGASASKALTDMEKKVCAQTGISHDDYIKARAARTADSAKEDE